MADEADRTEIGARTTVAGDIEAQQDVVVFGRVEGSIASTGAVIVEEGGMARAMIRAAHVLVAGAVVGDIRAAERIEITENGRVLGDVYTPRLILQDGGAVRGRVVMDGSVPAGEVAPAKPATASRAVYRPSQAPAAQGSARKAPAPAAPVRVREVAVSSVSRPRPVTAAQSTASRVVESSENPEGTPE